jgi:UDP-4-amino-4,6-dideoxy-N-acetyl-beta-L-altrosamine N-acetyltransferase
MLEDLTVRKMGAKDLVETLEWRNHSEVSRFMFTQHKISFAEHSHWFNKAIQDNTRQLLIIEECGTPIGFVQFSNVDTGGVADWGFYVRPNSVKGLGIKLCTAALDYAFCTLHLHKVNGQAIVGNQASINIHERLGFKKEGELRDQKRINDLHHTLICFGLMVNEWHASKNGSN